MKVPKSLIGYMKLLLKLSIPFTYIFMMLGALVAVLSLIKLEWTMFLFSLAFIGFAVLHRLYCIQVLDSIERTGTTYKWRKKIDKN